MGLLERATCPKHTELIAYPPWSCAPLKAIAFELLELLLTVIDRPTGRPRANLGQPSLMLPKVPSIWGAG